jgi:DNA-binding LytR/AlgR family response regulator
VQIYKFNLMEKIKIIIVEDELIIAESMSLTLSKEGYEVIASFDNGTEAIELVKKTSVDIVILDIAISGHLDGIETAKKIKEIEDVAVIFLSNLHDKKTLERAKAIRPDNYLLKPFTPNQLFISISNAIYNRSQNHESQLNTDQKENNEDGLTFLKDDLFIKNNNGGYKKYHVSEILFIKADRSYSYIFLENGEELLLTVDMKKLDTRINHPNFIKAHRSFIVNIANISEIKGNVIVLGKHEIGMTAGYKDNILRLLNIVK